MKEFDYDLDYKTLDFTDAETRMLYRIGMGRRRVRDEICRRWRSNDGCRYAIELDTVDGGREVV